MSRILNHIRCCIFVRSYNLKNSIKNKQFYSSIRIMKVLNVAEKNDAAKNIAGFLSRGNLRKREGLSKFNKLYEFNINLWGQQCTMIMTSVSGHLLNYDFTGGYKKWYGCHPLSLFDAPVVKQCQDENYINIKKTLEREIRNCQALIIWTDCDREGENIGFEIIDVCKAVKPHVRIYRAKFSEITQASINRAIQTLQQPNKTVSDAVDVRSELDLRIGAAFTRFQTLRFQKVFPRTLADMLISYGSCQFPTLGFVVERFLAIERFVSEPYWKIKVTDSREDISVEFRWDRGRLFEELPCQVFLDICLEQPEATVEKVTTKPKSKWRPVPLDTIELEKQGSRKLHLSAKQVMQIAEKLYTKGFISYPRTETNIFPKEMNLLTLVNQQVENPIWGQFASRVASDGPSPRQGKKSDQAHPPIHPTKYTDQLHGDEAKVYEFVVRHFLACLSKNAEGYETIVEINIAGEKFIASGLQIIAKNYLEVYIYEKWSDKEIHHYQQGQKFNPSEIEMVKEETSPPNLLTEADLIALMDKHGIGTDATHAEHIDTIKSRQYVGLTDGKHFMPGKLGIGLVMGYDNMGFQMSKPNLRAELENDLKLICEGQKDPKIVLQEQIAKYRGVFKIAMEKANLIDTALANYLEEQPNQIGESNIISVPEEVPIFKCPKCNANVVMREKKQDAKKYLGCMNYPTCNNAVWFPEIVENVEMADMVCNICPGNLRKLKFKFRRNALPIYGSVYETCIGGCDSQFNEALNIREENVRKRNRIINDSGYNSTSDNSRSNNRNNPSNSNQSQNSNASNILARNNWSQVVQGSSSNNTAKSNYSSNVFKESSNSKKPTTSKILMDKSWGHIDANEIIMCNCHEHAVALTVRKDGPNKGRRFYKCPKPDDVKCNFFQWATDDNDSNSTPNSSNYSENNFSNDNHWSDQQQSTRPGTSHWSDQQQSTRPSTSHWSNSNNSSSDISCSCGQSAKKLTVNKEGPNKGRQFYGCPKGMGSGCNFFKWADDVDNTGTHSDWNNQSMGSNWSGRGGAQSRGRGRGQNRSKGTGHKRKCGICGIEGHTRKTCPENVMD